MQHNEFNTHINSLEMQDDDGTYMEVCEEGPGCWCLFDRGYLFMKGWFLIVVPV